MDDEFGGLPTGPPPGVSMPGMSAKRSRTGMPIANFVDFDIGIIMQDLGQAALSQDAGTVLMAACRSILQLNITMGTVV